MLMPSVCDVVPRAQLRCCVFAFALQKKAPKVATPPSKGKAVIFDVVDHRLRAVQVCGTLLLYATFAILCMGIVWRYSCYPQQWVMFSTCKFV